MKQRSKAKRSIRTIILTWLFLFSIVPLAFVTGYSVLKFKNAIERNVNKNLQESFAKLQSELEEFESTLVNKSQKYVTDPAIVYGLSTSAEPKVQKLALGWVRNELPMRLTIFDRAGRMIVSVTPGSTLKNVQDQMAQGVLELDQAFLQRLVDKNQSRFVEFQQKIISETPQLASANLVVFSKVTSRSGRLVGYIEQNMDLDDIFEPLQKLLNLEIFLMNDKGEVYASSDEDFKRLSPEVFSGYINSGSARFFEMPFKSDPYGVMIAASKLGNTPINLGIAISKRDMTTALNNVTYAFIAVVGAVIVLLALTALVTTSWLLRPLDSLVSAVRTFKETGVPVIVPVTNETEVGVLSDNFNELVEAVHSSRTELEDKVSELEKAYSELKEAQAKLVHTAKMASLGQLVAGVAHELNNPIGFIYSNMSHMRDYSEKLVEFAEKIHKNPENFEKLKEEFEFDYIREDLPKLIDSCEDGAKRTRDIVISLRNFSRLDEAQFKKVNLNTALENTLNLLKGELKDRIQVEKNFSQLPEVECYATQINQVFMNILSNAAQAIEGEGKITVTTKAVEKFVEITIADTGKGIPDEVLEKVFDPFFTTKSIGKGTGLGLSISYRIIERHNGEISVSSQVGEGTEFKILLPV